MKDQFSEYSDTSGDSAETPITEDGAPEGEGDSIHLPAEFLMGKKFKDGDTVTLKVVSSDEEGVEVEMPTEADKNEGSEDEGGMGMMSANDEIDAAKPGY